MPFIAIPLVTAATAVSAGVAVAQGREQQKLANQQAKQVQTQADMEARRVETQSQYEQEQMLRERKLVLGRINRAYGTSGLTMAGTPLTDLTETTQNMTMDVLMNQYNATEQANAIRYNGASTAKIYKASGKAARTSGYWSAGQSIMGGISAYNSLPKTATPLKATQFGQSGRYGNMLRTSNIGNSYSRSF